MKKIYLLPLCAGILLSAITPLHAQISDRTLATGNSLSVVREEKDPSAFLAAGLALPVTVPFLEKEYPSITGRNDDPQAPIPLTDTMKSGRQHVLFAPPVNDDFANATDVSSLINGGCTSFGAYTTRNATPDQSKPACWTSGPTNNVWFKFTATAQGAINIKVMVSGPGETMRHAMLAIFGSGLSQLACEDANVAPTFDDCLGISGLTPGATYYFAVDDQTNTDAGRFDLCLTDVALATISYSASPYCASGIATATHTGQNGGTYSSTAGLAIDPSTGSVDLGASIPGTYNVSYNFSNGTCSDVAAAPIIINASPVASISYAPGSFFATSTFCATGTAMVTRTGQTGGVYSSSTGLVLNPATGDVDLVASTPGTYTVTYSTTLGSCSSTASAPLTIITLPSASISYAGSPYCATGTATVTQTGQAGGTYSSTTGLSINPATGSINLASSTAGTYTVTYSFTNGTCNNTTTTSVTINALPVAAFTYASSLLYPSASFCATGTATVTKSGQTGGTYSSTAGLSINPATGAINLAASTPGTYTVTYSFSNAGCSNTTTTSVTISPLPSAAISYNGSPYCATGSAAVTQTGQAGGTYSSSPGLSIDPVTGTVNLGSSAPGTYTVSYNFSNGTCSNTATATLTIISTVATASISYTGSPYCAAGSAAVTRTGQAGGTYSSTAGLSLNLMTGAINLVSSLPGTYTVTYVFPNGACSNTSSTTCTVTINPLPAAAISYTGSPYCASGTATVTQTGQTGGTYSSTTGLSISASTGAINLGASLPGVYTVTYSFSNGTCNNSTTATVTVNALASATISYTPNPYYAPGIFCPSGTAAVTQTGQTGGTYSSSSGLSLDPLTGTINLSASIPGPYTITYSFTNGICPSTATTSITISTLPVAAISYPGSPYCASGSTTVTQTGQGGGTYSSTSGLSIDAATGTVNLAASLPGTYTVTYTFSSGTCPNSTTATLTINPLPAATISYAAGPTYTSSSYCAAGTATVTQTGQAGGTYSSSTGLVINTASGTIDLGASTPGGYTVTYAFSNGTCSGTTAASLTIIAPPVLAVSNPAPVCPPATIDLTAPAVTAGSSSGLSFSYYTDAAATMSLSNPSAVSAGGTYYIKGTSASSCSSVEPVTVTFNTIPSAGISYSGSPYCAAGNAMVTQTGQSGGAYSASAGLSLDASTGAINLVTSTPGTYTVTYQFSNGTCSNTTTTSVSITALPVASVSYPGSPYCANGTATVTQTGQTGGTYSSTAGLSIDPVTGTINLGASTPGAYTVTYNFSSGSCNNTTSASVTVNALPSATIFYSGSPYCATGTAMVTQTGQAGGTYSSTGGLSIDASTGSIDLGSSTPGTYTITYSFTNGTCSFISTATATVTIIAPPTAAISYTGSPFCATGTAVVTQTGQTGGSYSSTTGLILDAVTGTISPSGSTPGTYVITYGFSNGVCSGSTSTTITVLNPTPTATIAYAGSPYCATGTGTVTQTGQGGGAYSSTAGLTIDPVTGAVNLAASTPGSYTVTYNFGSGACSGTTTGSLTINALPVLTITDPGAVCPPATVDLTDPAVTAGSSSGLSFGYYRNAAATLVLTNPAAVAVSGTYYIKATDGNSCVAKQPVTVTIKILPSAAISYPGSPYCISGSATVVQTGQGGGSYSSSPGLVIDPVTGTIDLTGSTPGTYTVTYSFSNGSCSNTATTSVTINAMPVAAVSYTGSPYCATGTAAVTLTGQGGGTYSSTSGLSLNGSTGTIDLGSSTAGTYTVTYNFGSGSCTSSTTCQVTVMAQPVLDITDPAAVCSPAGIDLTGPAVTAGSSSGLTLGYYSDPGATSSLGSPNAVTASGTYYIKGTAADACFSILPVNATIKTPPSAVISYTGTPYCNAGTAAVTQTGQSGGAYSAPAALIIDPATGTIDLGSSTAGTYTVTYSFSNGACGGTTTTSVTITAPPVVTVSNPAPVCPPATIDLTDPAVTAGSSSGLTYSYFTDAAATTPLTSPAAVSVAGTYYIKGTTAGSCSSIQPVTVSFNALPSAAISYDGAPYCPFGTATVTQTGQPGGSYSSTPGLIINGITGTINLVASTPGSYTVIYSFTNGTCSNTTTAPITVHALPTAAISYPAPSFCPSGTAVVTQTGQGGGTYGSTAGLVIDAMTGTIDLGTSTPGSYTVVYIFTNGFCNSSATAHVTVTSVPSASISYPGSPYCMSGTAAVTQTGQTGGFYSSTAGLSINAVNGTIDLAGSTPGTYTVTYSYTGGTCSNIATTTVVINALATAMITYNASPFYASGAFCPAGTATVTQTGQGGGTYSSTTGLIIDAATGNIDLSASTPGSYTVTYSFTSPACGAISTTTAPVLINALPVATIAYTGSPYCATGTAAVTQTGQTGGTYSSSTGLSIDPASGAVNLATSTPGTYLVQYSFSNGNCNNSTTCMVTVNALPAAAISYAGSPYCAFGTGTVTQSGLAGGIYSSTTGLALDPATGAINLVSSTPGTYTVSYSVSNGTCTNTATATVIIIALPMATISYPSATYCASGTANVSQTGQPGGTYSAAVGLAIDPVSGSVDLGASMPGVYTIAYQSTNGSCNNTATTMLTIQALPVAAISYAPSPYYASLPFCALGIAAVTQTGQGGGTYHSTAGLSLNSVTGAVDLGSSTPGTYTVTYNFTNGTCNNVVSTTITIINAAVTTTISYPGTPFCATGIAHISQTGQTGGVYSSLPGLSIDAVTGTVDLGASAPGTYTVTYSYSSGTCSSTATTSVTVVALASASITYASSPFSASNSYCASGIATVTQSGQAGGTYSSATGLSINAATGEIDLGASIAGTYTVTYTFTNGNCSNASTTTASVIINPIPAASVSYPGNPYCASGIATVTQTGQAGGVYSSTVGLSIDPMTGSVDLAASTAGTYNVWYNFSNGSCNNTTTGTITIRALPAATISYAPSIFYASSTYCSVGTAIVAQTGVAGGTYSSAAGLSLNTSSGQIDLTSSTPGTYTVTYAFTDGICSNTTTANVTIISTSSTASIAYPGSPYCGAEVAAVVQSGQPGGYYSSVPGLSLDFLTGAVNVAASVPGTYHVTYTFSNGTCIGNTSTSILINTTPKLSITNPEPVCMPGSIDLTDPAITAGSDPGLSYAYYSDQAATMPLTDPSYITTSSIYFIQGSNSSSCKSTAVPVTAVISAKPSLSATSDSAICKGSTITLSAVSPGISPQWLGTGSSDSVTVRPDVSTVYQAVATNVSGCSDTVSVAVRVLDFPLTLTADPDPVLAGTTLTLTSNSDSAYDVLAWLPLNEFQAQTAASQSFIVNDSSQLFGIIAQSAWGCRDTVMLVANVTPNTKDFFIPNAFTPNGDGLNDVFKAYGASIRDIDLRVFSQWGQMLWETRDPAQGWDGTYNGNKQPVGVYIYVVRAELYGGKIITKRSSFSLIR